MVIKRNMAAGFAGIDNPLCYLDRTLVLFGDAKGFVGNVVRELSGRHDEIERLLRFNPDGTTEKRVK